MRSILLNIFSHRTMALMRWDLHFIKVRIINSICFNKQKLTKRVKNAGNPVYLNLGSGPRGLDRKDWINIDGFIDKEVHFVCDFTKRLPFADNTFDGIFCEHVLEHFDYTHGKQMMAECNRVLKKGGIVRIIVPNGETIMRSYFEEPGKIIDYKHCENKFAMEAVNTWFYQRYEHQCIYDAAYLVNMLKSAGFSSAIKEEYQKTSNGNEALLIDDEKYKWESLYVEATK